MENSILHSIAAAASSLLSKEDGETREAASCTEQCLSYPSNYI
jgi:hypothetical protein